MKLHELHEAVKEVIEPVSVADLIGDHTGEAMANVTLNYKALTTLKGCPAIVDNDAYFNYNGNLKTLKYGPTEVGGNFFCAGCGLSSLEFAPTKIGRNFVCSENKKLKSLKHAPKQVAFLDAHSCGLTSLEGIPEYIKDKCYLAGNKLTNLHNIHKHLKHCGGLIDFRGNKIKSHILGLLLIDGLKSVILNDPKLTLIINNQLMHERDVLACQEELIDAGYEEFAEL